MLYIRDISGVSPQGEFSEGNETLKLSVENKLKAVDPSFEGIPPNALRRMGKAVRMSVGAALPLFKKTKELNGIIIGTANGGMEDCIRFMNQIVDYDEGMLTPANFVQSTPNGLAAQLGLMQRNKGYNITHSHRGLSFENALIDAQMLLEADPEHSYLLGAADEISTYNYNVDFLEGWYKKESLLNTELHNSDTEGSLAGEGAVMLIVSGLKTNACAKVSAVKTLHTEDKEVVKEELKRFLDAHLKNGTADLLITGENGDSRFLPYYEAAETLVSPETGVLRFKHLCGEFPTASSQGLALACYILRSGKIPASTVKKKVAGGSVKNILIFNNYKGAQHSFMLVSLVESD